MFGKFFSIIGLLFILHAAYSAHHYKGILLELGMINDTPLPPNDVIIEIIIGFTILLFAQLFPIQLVPVRVNADRMTKTWEEAMSRPEFGTFNHRGRSLFKRQKV